MNEPIYLQLTNVYGVPVWINMSWVWKIYRKEEYTCCHILNAEVKQLVIETPEKILEMLNKALKPNIIVPVESNSDASNIVGYDEYMKKISQKKEL